VNLIVSNSAKYLLIGSTAAYSGKSATIVGIAHQLKKRGLDIAYGKPLGTMTNEDGKEADVSLITKVLDLAPDRLHPTLLYLEPQTLSKRLAGEDQADYQEVLRQYTDKGNLVILEATASLGEGMLFDLCLRQMAETLDGAVLIVARFHPQELVDHLLAGKRELGDRLAGVLINDVPPADFDLVTTKIRPYLEKQGIPVLAVMPRSEILRSVSVQQLVQQLNAEVLCRGDRLDLMVQSLKIGAMNVNSALKYFRKGTNMAVVTGGDRSDIQLAALETSTNCLILTGQIAPQPFILSRAEDLEIPILSVDLDTLSTVEIIDQAFGQVRLYEPIKINCIQQLMVEHFDFDRLLNHLEIKLEN
jgi:BioD-like phosphotransacetylase family protein